MKRELSHRGIEFKSEMSVPIYYRDELVQTDLFCDLFVENALVVELKAVEKVLPIQAQLLSYMKLLSVPMGLMINFNCLNIFEYGQKTYVNELYRFLH